MSEMVHGVLAIVMRMSCIKRADQSLVAEGLGQKSNQVVDNLVIDLRVVRIDEGERNISLCANVVRNDEVEIGERCLQPMHGPNDKRDISAVAPQVERDVVGEMKLAEDVSANTRCQCRGHCNDRQSLR